MNSDYEDLLSYGRVISVSFYTSNVEKLLQARLLFGRRGYRLAHIRSGREPYEEYYEAGEKELLRRAIKQVRDQFGLRSAFFIEDTSLRLEAFSRDADFPGPKVKEWFSDVTFEEVDRQLRSLGNDRRATVKSDIALYLPGLSRPIFFHGETTGTIAESAPTFDPSVQYPWLTPRTFNGWFVPEGATKRLGEMEFEESIEFDFRAKALLSLLERLVELSAAASLPSSNLTHRRFDGSPGRQLSLLEPSGNVVLVVGQKCAGKTTFGDFATETGQADVFEASSLLRSTAFTAGREIRNSADAKAFLKDQGQDAVARRLNSIIDASAGRIVVVTGFRTVEEVLFMVKNNASIVVVSIDADARLRFERHIRRGRAEGVRTFKDFLQVDEEQMSFGLLRVVHELADVMLVNDGSIGEYRAKFERLWSTLHSSRAALTQNRRMRISTSESLRSLAALRRLGRSASCEEIAEETARDGRIVRTYNNNRALKRLPEFAKRIEPRDKAKLKYKLLGQGRELLELVDRFVR